MRFDLTVLCLALLHPIVQASVIGIDFGSEWFKVSIVKTGVPLDIVLNRESKRKTESLVTIRDGIRYFGTDAAGLSTRFPESTYPFVKNLIGLQYNDPIAVEYRSWYSNNMVPEPLRNTCAFKLSGDVVYTVEEILAMQLAHAKRQAEISGGESISGAVITVPPYYNHYERQAVLDAAEIANLRVLQLMNDGTAVALNYAMTRPPLNGTAQHHLFFDMGAGSTVATLVKFTSTKVKKLQIPTLEILSTGFDKKLGGKAIDVKLQKHLAKLFMTSEKGAKAKEPVINNARSMAKLLKEANRVKQILSANTETMASVEGLHEEIDFRVKVTRAELEGLCGDYFKKLTEPIKAVLKEANLPLAKLDSLILVGGAVRIPAVQAVLKELVGESKIAQNVNQDEANVLGAGFRAAGISKQFRVREIKIKDASSVPIEIVYNLESQDGSAGKLTTTPLFPKNTTLPSKKLMNFKRTTDFDFSLKYKDASSPILSAKVSGLADAIAKHKDTAVDGFTKVQAQIELTDSGVLDVEHATVTFELKQEEKKGGSIAENVMNFFGGKKDKKEGEKKEDEKKAEEASGEKDAKKDEKSDEKKEEKKDEKKDDKKDAKKDAKKDTKKNATESESKKITTSKVKLTVDIKYETLPPLTKEVKDAAKSRFAKMDDEDAARRAREEAFNNLEAFIYSSQAFLESEVLPSVSTEEQREALSLKVASAQEWLDEDDLRKKLNEVKEIRAPMSFRVKELEARPKAVADYRITLTQVQAYVDAIRANNTLEDNAIFGLYEDKEFVTGLNKIKEFKDWIEEKEEAQAKVAAYETPAFKSRDVEAKKEDMVTSIVKLFSKVPKKPVKPKTTTTIPASGKASATTAGEGATETDKPVSEEKPASEILAKKDAPVGSEEDSETGETKDTKEDGEGHDEL
ncbi:HSP70-domain-containing protein [Rhizoclosmatium globosum]|uniref:HSP70-domain-containing protein n=1 Tax=Rhizoclosmatium globosum TaxID=329046 RepID=A0A1Y2AVG6_9FUNG|nr:HSP70-domain-containing protein [Rhizoclosmatium globosum]|eukprot:ORY26444.1 HSP70-domain-containing protein [Rhizoclosmatium globosum]